MKTVPRLRRTTSRSEGASRSRSKLPVLTGGLLLVTGGCAEMRVSSLRLTACPPRRAPSEVRVLFTRRAVGRDFRVVARYQVRTQNMGWQAVLRRLRARAARDGADALLIERAVGDSSTVWSWALLLVPSVEHGRWLEVTAIRFQRPGGDS